MIRADQAKKLADQGNTDKNAALLKELLNRVETAVTKTATAQKPDYRCNVNLTSAEENVFEYMKREGTQQLEAYGYKVSFHKAVDGDSNEQLDYGRPAHIEIYWGD